MLGYTEGMLIQVAVLLLAFLPVAAAIWWWRRPASPPVKFDPTMIGDDPDAWLAAREDRHPTIRPGLRKSIIWRDPQAKARTPFSIVYIHGFSASSGEIRPVPDLLAARLNANLYYTRLTGHGMDGEALGRATIEDWTGDVAEAIAIGERIGRKVIVVATSTGAALATWAFAQPQLSGRIAAAVFLSPNFGLKAAGSFLLSTPFARPIVHAVIGRTRGFEPANPLHERLWTASYPTDALLPMARSIDLANHARRAPSGIPALFLYSPDDQTVDPNKIERAARQWGGPHRLVAIGDTEDPSCHVLAGDALSPQTTEAVAREIGDWLEDTLALATPGRGSGNRGTTTPRS